MGARTDEIEAVIALHRAELQSNLEYLEESLKAVADWRTHYRKHIVASTVGAFAVGALAALMLGRSN